MSKLSLRPIKAFNSICRFEICIALSPRARSKARAPSAKKLFRKFLAYGSSVSGRNARRSIGSHQSYKSPCLFPPCTGVVSLTLPSEASRCSCSDNARLLILKLACSSERLTHSAVYVHARTHTLSHFKEGERQRTERIRSTAFSLLRSAGDHLIWKRRLQSPQKFNARNLMLPRRCYGFCLIRCEESLGVFQ